MSDLFQVTIVVPAEKLGAVLSALPPKLQPQISRLVEKGPPRGKYTKTRDKNGEYQPAKGTASEALLKLLRRSDPMRRAEMCAKLPKAKRAALMSALDRFVAYGLVRKEANGAFGAVK